MRSILAGVAAGLVVLVLGAGCGDTSRESLAYELPDLGSHAPVEAPGHMPFDRYRLSWSERERLQSGYVKLLRACLAAKGLDTEFQGDYVRGTRPVLWHGLLGTLPLSRARDSGYQALEGEPFVNGPGFYLGSVNNVHPITNDEATLAALSSSSSDSQGCHASVEARLAAPYKDAPFMNLERDLRLLTAEHPLVRQAIDEWSTCMESRGHHFNEVWEPTVRFGNAELTTAEISVAVADVRCTGASNWAALYYTALADYQQQVIEAGVEELDAYRAAEMRRLQRVDEQVAALSSGVAGSRH